MLCQLWCHCNPDQDKFSFTVVAVFPNVCLWRRSLCANLVLTLKNCIEPPSYASTGYVVAIWSSFLFDSFVQIWGTCDNFLGKWSTAPPGKKFPVRLWWRTNPKGRLPGRLDWLPLLMERVSLWCSRFRDSFGCRRHFSNKWVTWYLVYLPKYQSDQILPVMIIMISVYL